ncbi:hypothetical protein AC249_AIPGENE24157 [Exaiptasia diaphana]|nr:hypothetical protein AC249_AIPGENE24157 [Exaiptasia diaphana]
MQKLPFASNDVTRRVFNFELVSLDMTDPSDNVDNLLRAEDEAREPDQQDQQNISTSDSITRSAPRIKKVGWNVSKY